MKKLLPSLLLVLASFAGFAQLNMSLKSKYSFAAGVQLSNLWGYTDAIGNEYALVGTTDGMHIIDVSNPNSSVHLHHIPGPSSIWREVRTYQNYAYVTTEGGGGLQIVDLSALPNTITVKQWTGSGAIAGQLTTIHALHIDQHFLYLYGSKLFNGAPLIVSLTDPWEPQYINNVGNIYVHDGIVRNDSMFAGHIYAGYFSVYDVSNKMNPVLLATQQTPSRFTHNTWLSDDGKTLFTTDEVDDSFLTSYDITDFTDIRELSRIQMNPGGKSVVHNTHVLNDFAVTSWYKDGVVIVDGKRPENLVIVGHYDTSPMSGPGMDGCWGVYPYFSSGNIIASDMQQGLFVLGADYKRACYLEGNVTDSICGTPLANVEVKIVQLNISQKTNNGGIFKTGTPTPGTYTITFSAPGYTSKTFNNVALTAGQVTNLNVKLYSTTSVPITGKVEDMEDGAGLHNSFVLFESSTGAYSFTSNTNGEFARCNFLSGNYEVTTGKWGYVTECSQKSIDASASHVNVALKEGFYDDFTFNFGWTVTGDAATGHWERGKPVGTTFNGVQCNPASDVSTDCSDRAYVTGNAGGSAGADDIDDGRTVLTSPSFDLTKYDNPTISYYRWFYNGGGSSAPNDTLTVRLNNGTTTVVLERVLPTTPGMSTWVQKKFVVKDFITITNNMKISFDAVDANPGHLVEAGVDKFEILGDIVTNVSKAEKSNGLKVYPNPFSGQFSVAYDLGESLHKPAILRITDITGRLVLEKGLGEAQGLIQTEINAPKGIYFLTVSNGETQLPAVKLVKLR
jgi:choice-of-anchor B domain-containing protein